jgi:hypothetical protein|tara:strand:+ start:1263 stop:1544 length:282 start_codon:yes stop_codon:yes gene_type:complete
MTDIGYVDKPQFVINYSVLHGDDSSNLTGLNNFILYRVAMEFFRDNPSKVSILFKVNYDDLGYVTTIVPKKRRGCSINKRIDESLLISVGSRA